MAKTSHQILAGILTDFRMLALLLTKDFLAGHLSYEQTEAAWEVWVETGKLPGI